jgi:hypothetical protein
MPPLLCMLRWLLIGCSAVHAVLCCAGIVVLMLDSKMEPAIAKDMVRGAADTLYSGETRPPGAAQLGPCNVGGPAVCFVLSYGAVHARNT